MQYGTSYGYTLHHLTKVLYTTFKDMVLYSTKSGSPMITSQEPLLVLYGTIFLEWNHVIWFFPSLFFHSFQPRLLLCALSLSL